MIRRPSPAMVVALVALFLALGGVAYGVAESSIGTRAIKDGGVLGRDIKDGAVQGRDVKDGALLGSDLKDGSVRGNDVHDGSLGGDRRRRRHAARRRPRQERDRRPRDRRDPARHRGGWPATTPSATSATFVRCGSRPSNDATTPKRRRPPDVRAGTRLLGGGAHAVAPARRRSRSPTTAQRRDAWTASAYATAPTGDWQLVVIAICG